MRPCKKTGVMAPGPDLPIFQKKGGDRMKIALSYGSLRADRIARLAGGTLFLRGIETPPSISHICTDSREADANTLFCAMRGERVDGHRFIPAALRAGCAVVLCEHLPDGWEDPSDTSPLGSAPLAAVVVEDTVKGLGRMAAARRAADLADLCAIGVTGSVGKTTTKEMIASVLSAAHGKTVFKKDGNYNSTIGLPLSVMEIPASEDFAVLEMGMSARGEIAAMSAAVRPNIAVIANVGSSHLEHLGTRENIALAKLEIAEGLSAGGVLLINGDEPLLAALGEDLAGERPVIPSDIRVLRMSLAGQENADVSVRNMAAVDGGMRFDLDTPMGRLSDLYVPAIGEHMVWAAAFAATVGLLCGLDASSVRQGLAAYRTAALRQASRTVADVTLIEDCYNAAPESMRAALGVLSLSAGGRKIAVLGDMRELGEGSEALHRHVGEAAARIGVDLLVTVGPLGAAIAAGATDAGLPPEKIHVTAATGEIPAAYSATAAFLAAFLQKGDTVLFKASRALALETLSAELASCLRH